MSLGIRNGNFCSQFLKLRGWPQYAWVIRSQNHVMSKAYNSGHFVLNMRRSYLILPLILTQAIST